MSDITRTVRLAISLLTVALGFLLVPGPAYAQHETAADETTPWTFLLTDIEGSVPHWERDADAMQRALVRHDTIIGACVAHHGGTVVHQHGEGDRGGLHGSPRPPRVEPGHRAAPGRPTKLRQLAQRARVDRHHAG